MVFLLVVSFFLSAATCILLIRRLNAHARHYQEDKPQRFHAAIRRASEVWAFWLVWPQAGYWLCWPLLWGLMQIRR